MDHKLWLTLRFLPFSHQYMSTDNKMTPFIVWPPIQAKTMLLLDRINVHACSLSSNWHRYKYYIKWPRFYKIFLKWVWAQVYRTTYISEKKMLFFCFGFFLLQVNGYFPLAEAGYQSNSSLWVIDNDSWIMSHVFQEIWKPFWDRSTRLPRICPYWSGHQWSTMGNQSTSEVPNW